MDEDGKMGTEAFSEASVERVDWDRFADRTRVGEWRSVRVFQALDLKSERPVGLAVFKDKSTEAMRHLEHSLRVTAGFTHSNVLPILGHGLDDDGFPFYVVPPIRGVTMDSMVPSYESVVPPDVIAAFCSLCEAVVHAHAKGVVHCDLRPENVWIGAGGELMLSGWGSSRGIGSGAVDEDRPVSIPGFLAPECVSDDDAFSEATDQFALGVILHLLLTGRLPVRGNTHDERLLATKWKSIEPFWPGDKMVDARLVSICRRALEPEPEERYSDVSGMLVDLLQYQDRTAVWYERTRFCKSLTGSYENRRRVLRSALAGVLGILFLSVVAYSAWDGWAVHPDELDYLRAHRLATGDLLVVGAWEAPGGSYLSAVDHEVDKGQLVIRLFGKPTLTRWRMFRVTIPGDHLERSTLQIAAPDGGGATLQVRELRYLSPDRPLAVEVESRER